MTAPTKFVPAIMRHLASAPVRWALGAVIAFVLAATAIVWLLTQRANDLLAAHTVESLYREAAGIFAQSRGERAPDLRAIVGQLSRVAGPNLYALVDSDGKMIVGNFDPVPEWIGRSAVGTFRFTQPTAAMGQTAKPRLGVAVVVTLDVPEGGNRVMRKLVVGRDTEDQRAFTEAMRRMLLASMAALALIGLGGGLLASRMILRRLDAVSATSRSIMAGDLSRRIPLDGSGDEFDRLARSLNAMLTRNEELAESLREVSSNIAHDLKTPLNRLRNTAEAALRDPTDAATHRDALARVIEEADGLMITFNALLLIARLEGGTIADDQARLDISAIVRDVVELYEPLAEAEGVALTLDAPAPVFARANRELVGQAVFNLIDNALKYGQVAPEDASRRDHAAVGWVKPSRDPTRSTPPAEVGTTVLAAPHADEIASSPPATITIRVSETAGRVAISVADHGPGIAPQDRARVLKRFVRLEKSRSAPGTGLGLSLVAAVARLHGGEVALSDNAPGLRVTLSLPTME